MKMKRRRLTGILFSFWILVFSSLYSETPMAADAEEYITSGLKLFKYGRFADAVEEWKQAEILLKSEKEPLKHTDVFIYMASGYRTIGKIPDAMACLRKALDTAERLNDQLRIAKISADMGILYRIVGDVEKSQHVLDVAHQMAQQIEDPELKASILNNLGNLHESTKRYPAALEAYDRSLKLSGRGVAPSLNTRTLINAARVLSETGEYQEAGIRIFQAKQQIQTLEDTHDKAFFMISAGKLFKQIRHDAITDAEEKNRMILEEYGLYQSAARIAEKLDASYALSYAYGCMGSLYEDEKRYEDALYFTRKAVFEAQRSNISEIMYQWQWQSGRLMKNMDNIDGAISSYRLAVYHLKRIRDDFSRGCNKGTCMSFRDAVGPVYFELADLLLKRSSHESAPENIQKDLIEARNTVEQLKVVELQDYFQDECLAANQSRSTDIDDISKGKIAAVYPIMLPDRTELLVSLKGKMKQFTVSTGSNELTRVVERFRKKLQQPSSRFLREARKLNQWLIAPFEKELAKENIDTLIFIPDAALRTIPMSVLHDGKKFLIDRYAVVTTPGLTMTDPKPLARQNLQMLLNGLTEGVQGFSPLPNVNYELQSVNKLYNSKMLKNESFTTKSVEQALKSTPYSVVHIASHGQFDRNPKNTFLLTHDDKLTIDVLEKLVRMSDYREEPVELLTLSACQTAVGDDRAALGLAGVAIKAGARSALATLWFIDDAATSRMVTAFYHQLKNPEISKAKALQNAQIKLKADARFKHPAFWAPFLLIGNWL